MPVRLVALNAKLKKYDGIWMPSWPMALSAKLWKIVEGEYAPVWCVVTTFDPQIIEPLAQDTLLVVVSNEWPTGESQEK